MIKFNVACAAENGNLYVLWNWRFSEAERTYWLDTIGSQEHNPGDILYRCKLAMTCLEDTLELAEQGYSATFIFDQKTMSWWLMRKHDENHQTRVDEMTEVTPRDILYFRTSRR